MKRRLTQIFTDKLKNSFCVRSCFEFIVGIFASVMRKIAGYLTKNRSEKDQKIAQSTHENGYIKPRKTFWRNSKQLLNLRKSAFPL